MFAVPETQTNWQTNCFHKLNSLSMQNVQPVSLVVFTNSSLVQLMWLFFIFLKTTTYLNLGSGYYRVVDSIKTINKIE